MFREYLAALWVHWWALMSCAGFTFLSIGIGIGSQHSRWGKWFQAWEWKISLALAGFFFFLSGYYAWQDQYKQNEQSRGKGKIYLRSLQVNRYRESKGKKDMHGYIQLILNLENVEDGLVVYRFDDFSLKSGATSRALINAQPAFHNIDTYAYAHHPLTSLMPSINVDDITAPFVGNLAYTISYHAEGSNISHHTRKAVSFTCFIEQPECVYVIASEHED